MKPDLDFARDALVLDIDGTLIEIAPAPEDVVVPPDLVRTLAALRPLLGGALAFCSGRTLQAVDALFAPLKLAAIGAHGAEIRVAPDAPMKVAARTVPQAAKDAFADVEQRFPGVRVEDKTYTLAFHFRQAPRAEDALGRLIGERLARLKSDLTVLHGKAIFELKEPGFNKGTGFEALMGHPPFHGRRPVFLGDDQTDEDVMAVLARYGGVGISVGRLLKGAQGEFAAPAQVRAWLSQMATEEA
ncbi:MAG: trehalose-phosphatase [Rhizomicrobium sp.]